MNSKLSFWRHWNAALLALLWAVVIFPLRANDTQPVSVIDVLMLYTPQASAGAGGAAAIRRDIDEAMVEANAVFQNSRIHARLRLAMATNIDYIESGSVSNDLAKLCNPGNGPLAKAHQLRDLIGADLVCLVTETGDDWSFYGLQGPSAENAFSIIRRPFLAGDYVLPVVLSFNFGCQLERASADSVGAFPYAYGYSFWAGDNYFSTVEAFSGQRIPCLSNPDILFQGVPAGVPAGSPGAADNALVINQTAPLVAAFRPPAPLTLPPRVQLTMPVDGQRFRAGSTIPLQATAADADGKVLRIDYYAGTNRIGSATGAPFSTMSSNLPLGAATVIAVATDNAGASSISDPVSITAGPANDDFANRERFLGAAVTVDTDTSLASAEAGEPTHGGMPAAHSLWWTFTAPTDGVVLLDATGGGVWASLDAYVGNRLTDLSEIATTGTGESAVRFPIAANRTCQIALDTPNDPGPVELRFRFTPLAANDNFARRQVLRGGSIRLKADNSGATRELDEPNHGGTPGSASLWWTWTAPADGALLLSATNSAGNNWLLGVYTGATLDSLVSASPQFQYPATFLVAVQKGVAYQIAVDSPADPLQPGPFILSLNFTPEPVNDRFAHRTPLEGAWISVSNSIALATVEPGTPANNGGWMPSLWWSWVAPFSGDVSLSGPASQSIDVFTGTVLTNLTNIASGSSVTFHTKAGGNYAIAVSTMDPAVEFHLALSSLQLISPANGATYFGGANIRLAATAAASEGPLRQVQFFENGTLLAMFNRAPYQWTWRNVPPGAYTLTVVDTDWFGHNRSAPPVNITVQYSPPSNDNFAARIPLQGTALIVTNSDQGATRETGEPPLGQTGYANSIWWSWTAPATGRVTISTPTPLTTFGVFTGASLSTLTAVASGGPSASFDATAGATYSIAAVGYPAEVVLQLVLSNLRLVSPADGETFVIGTNIVLQAQPTATEGAVRQIEYFNNNQSLGASTVAPYAFTWTNVPGGDASLTAVATDAAGFARSSQPITIHIRPPNDDFTNAIGLTGDFAHVTGSTRGATMETGEPGPAESVSTGRSVWYTWTAPASGAYSVIGDPADWELTLQVFTGPDVAHLSQLNDPDSRLTARLNATAGATYNLQLVDAAGVDFTLDIAAIPPNDNFSNAIVLNGLNWMVTGNNLAATTEPGEPYVSSSTQSSLPIFNLPPNHSVWYQWTAPATGLATVAINGGNSNPIALVYTGSSLSNLTAVFSSRTQITFHTTAGATYHLAVDSDGGPFTLDLPTFVPFANNSFSSRLPLLGMHPTVQATLCYNFWGGITFNPTLITNLVWYSWTAPADGAVWVNCPNCPTTVYTGNPASSLVPVTSETSSPYTFAATAGTEYEIAVGVDLGTISYPGSVPFTLSLVMPKAQIISPTNGTALPAPASFLITARTIDIDGAVTNLGFFDGTNFLGARSQAPFQFEYTNVPAGRHLLTLASIDQNGLMTTSAPVEVRVKPLNDDFANRIPLPGTRGTWTADNSGATTEPGEILPGGATRRTLWWTWTAPTNGSVTIDANVFAPDAPPFLPFIAGKDAPATQVHPNDVITIGIGGLPGPTTGPMVTVYTGDAITNLSLYAADSGWFPTGDLINSNGSIIDTGVWYVVSPLAFPVAEGQTYQISLDGVNGSFGPAAVDFSFTPAPMPPANDDFADRITITSPIVLGTTTGATREPGEPYHGTDGGARTVWYSWPASATGMVQMNASGSSSLAVAVYVGTNLDTLIPVTADYGSVAFYALAGITYQVAVAGPAGLQTDFSLMVQGPPAPPTIDPTRTVRLSNGAYQVCVSGAVGESFIVQSSPDLKNWTTIRTDTLVSPSLTFTDGAAAGYPQMHYRVIPLDSIFNLQPLDIAAGQANAGNFPVWVSGAPGQPFRLQSSTNLVDWEDVTSGIMTNQMIEFLNDASQSPQRFYRELPQ